MFFLILNLVLVIVPFWVDSSKAILRGHLECGVKAILSPKQNSMF
jgi:hypothetical protein